MTKRITGIAHFDAAINAATNLEELLEAITAEYHALSEEDRKDLDLTGLPTYGGEAPADTMYVWSWDEDRLLVGERVEDFHIVTRAEWDARP